MVGALGDEFTVGVVITRKVGGNGKIIRAGRAGVWVVHIGTAITYFCIGFCRVWRTAPALSGPTMVAEIAVARDAAQAVIPVNHYPAQGHMVFVGVGEKFKVDFGRLAGD